MYSLADSYTFWLTLFVVLGMLYVLPSLICAFILPRRRTRHRPVLQGQ